MEKKSGLHKQFAWQEFFLWFLLCAVMIVGIWANNHYSDVDSALRATAGIFWLGLLLGIGSRTKHGKQFLLFTDKAWQELKKVVWPTRHETLQTTIIVIVIVLFLMLILWLIDSLLVSLTDWVAHYS